MKMYAFSFRVWIYPQDTDPPDFEVWYPHPEIVKVGQLTITDWLLEVLKDTDPKVLVDDYDPKKCYQVMGEGVAYTDVWAGEDKVQFIKGHVSEVPPEYFIYSCNLFT